MLLFKTSVTAGRRVWFKRVDFPEPETPVMHIKRPKGMSRSTSLRLCPEAPFNFSQPSSDLLLLGFLLLEGILIFFCPDKYWPVIEFLDLDISFAVPSAQTFPP